MVFLGAQCPAGFSKGALHWSCQSSTFTCKGAGIRRTVGWQFREFPPLLCCASFQQTAITTLSRFPPPLLSRFHFGVERVAFKSKKSVFLIPCLLHLQADVAAFICDFFTAGLFPWWILRTIALGCSECTAHVESVKGTSISPHEVGTAFFPLVNSYCVTYIKLILPVVLNCAYGIKAWNKSSAISCSFSLAFSSQQRCVLVGKEIDPSWATINVKRGNG